SDHFDALGGANIQVVGTTLAIRQRDRDTVAEHLDTTNTETGPSTKATDGNAQILGKVIAILHKQPRHPGERLIQIELLSAHLDIILHHKAYGLGNFPHRLLGTRTDHDDLLQTGLRGGLHRRLRQKLTTYSQADSQAEQGWT